MSKLGERKIFTDEDADVSLLTDKTIAIIGYGNQGNAQAFAMKKLHGLNVIVGNIRDEGWDRAKADGLEVFAIEDASKKADVVFLLVPDEVAPQVYYEKVEPNIGKRSVVLNFASGYNVSYGFIRPREGTDCIMVAPRMIGYGIMDLVNQGMGYPTLIGVAQDSSGMAWKKALAIAKAIGSLLPGGLALESSFDEETLVDLFSEHSWAGAMLYMMKACFEALTEAGVAPEVALIELYASGELVEFAKAVVEIGLFEQLRVHSRTSQYGQLTWGPRYVTQGTKELLRQAIQEIKDGSFATEWMTEMRAGMPKYKRLHQLAKEYAVSKSENSLYKLLKKK